MKPIILVILGAAMLMPAMHQSNNSNGSKSVRKPRQAKHAQFELKKDTETAIHSASYWIDRMP